MIKNLHKKYFQKSSSFLFPLLGIPKVSVFQPNETYISWEGHYKVTDRVLLCLYSPGKTGLEPLKRHSLYKTDLLREDDSIVYVFDFTKYSADWDKFLQGKYSQLSETVKTKIKQYYKEGKKETDYMMTFLYPEDHIKTYSELLQVKESIIKEVGELCNPYDPSFEDLYSQPISSQQKLIHHDDANKELTRL